MKPLMLKAGERALTKVKYNREGDLLFMSTKEKTASVWYSENGEKLGTYQGHSGCIWSLDVSWDSQHLLTGSADFHTMLWDCETGTMINQIQNQTVIRNVGFSYSGNLIMFTNIQQMNQPARLHVYDIRDGTQMANRLPFIRLDLETSAPSACWSHLDDTIITGHDKGQIDQWDLREKKSKNFNNSAHKLNINDLQMSPDQSMIITASKDNTAKLFDAETMDILKTYKTERPVNSAAISPIRDHVLLGGGEDAMSVTQTAAGQGAFEAKLYHMVFEDEFARIKGHFGPINSLAFHPSGRAYASGAEDGYVRLNTFDQEYYDFEFDYL